MQINVCRQLSRSLKRETKRVWPLTGENLNLGRVAGETNWCCWGMRAIANCFESEYFLQKSCDHRYRMEQWCTSIHKHEVSCPFLPPACPCFSYSFPSVLDGLVHSLCISFLLSHPHSGFSHFCNLHPYQVSKGAKKKNFKNCIFRCNNTSETSLFAK